MAAISPTPGETTTRLQRIAFEASDIVESFAQYFDIVPANSDELLQTVFKIRYSVYAEELGWEDRQKFPAGLEQDSYDKHSAHCLLKHRPTNEYIGCVRLVMHNPTEPQAWFPFEHLFGTDFVAEHPALQGEQRHEVGEISRIAVLSSFRHRSGERNRPETEIDAKDPNNANERRRFPHIALGLYLAAAAMGIARGKSSVFAMMEPKLARRLRIFGIQFEQLGDAIDHRGIRAPYRVSHQNFVNGLAPPMQALLQFIQGKIEQ